MNEPCALNLRLSSHQKKDRAMPDRSTSLGLAGLLKSIRKRRGLSQRELSELSGVSLSWIRKLEQGTAEDTRMETAHRLARALRVPTSKLIPAGDSAPPDASDVEQWTTVRRALEGRFDRAEPEEVPTLEGLTEIFTSAAVPALQSNSYAQLQMIFPHLLRDIDRLVDLSEGPAKLDARRLRSQVRQITAWLMSHTWQHEAAEHAIALAIDDAPDEHTATSATDWQCWGLIRQGRLAETREIATRWADNIEPRMTKASREDLAGWGRMMIRVSVASTRDNRPGDAEDALRFAHMAAIGIGRDYVPSTDAWTVFGPATVAMIRAENALIQDRPDATLKIGSRIDGARFPHPRNWARHRLDVAFAYIKTGNVPAGVEVLQDVRQRAPEWIMTQRYARDILGEVIEQRRSLTADVRELADAIRLPY
ncbi:helix-turn-helix domain-containing protein [Streptosporangium canum]|uniref:helix-turn-helix domain-containing protein n=1 Tax=Streptosporangium canum TaxID=324952 RepID=UPI0036C1E25F